MGHSSRKRRYTIGMLVLLLIGGAIGWVACGSLELRKDAVTLKNQAPDFNGSTHLGEEIALSGLLERGPVILVFYRGHW